MRSAVFLLALCPVLAHAAPEGRGVDAAVRDSRQEKGAPRSLELTPEALPVDAPLTIDPEGGEIIAPPEAAVSALEATASAAPAPQAATPGAVVGTGLSVRVQPQHDGDYTAHLRATHELLSLLGKTLQERLRARVPDLGDYFDVSVRRGTHFDIDEGGSIAIPDRLITGRDTLSISPEIVDALETMMAHEIGHGRAGRFYSRTRLYNSVPRAHPLRAIHDSVDEMHADLTAMVYRDDPAAVHKAAVALGVDGGGSPLRDFSSFHPAAQISAKIGSYYDVYANVGSHLWRRYFADPRFAGRGQELLDAVAQAIADFMRPLEPLSENDLRQVQNGHKAAVGQKRLTQAVRRRIRAMDSL